MASYGDLAENPPNPVHRMACLKIQSVWESYYLRCLYFYCASCFKLDKSTVMKRIILGLLAFISSSMIAAPVWADPRSHVPKREEAARPPNPTIYRLLYLQDRERRPILVYWDGSQFVGRTTLNQRRHPLCVQCSSPPTKQR